MFRTEALNPPFIFLRVSLITPSSQIWETTHSTSKTSRTFLSCEYFFHYKKIKTKVTHEPWGATVPGVEYFCSSPPPHPFPGWHSHPSSVFSSSIWPVPLINLRGERDHLEWHFLSTGENNAMRRPGLKPWDLKSNKTQRNRLHEAFASKWLYKESSSWIHTTKYCRPVSRKVRKVPITRN